MSYPGRATSITLKREIKGTNTLTFQMPDRYFDSLKGEFVRNEFIDMISPETKIKLFYKDRWFEFFVKKVDEKKQFKSYMKTFTCNDAFIDELSRNGYGIIYDTDLYNNVEEIGTFTEETLEDSIWQYHPENNWGDFTEYKEEKLYRIPVSCFGGTISGYKLNFELENEQRERIEANYSTDVVTNPFTKDERVVELSDDLARGCFWDEYKEDAAPINELTKDYHTNIPNDGYIYVPYSCLGFCYGSEDEPDFEGILSYDRAATETAISVNDKLILAPQSVDPRTLIQFYAIPDNAVLELDDAGVIMNKDYTFFMTLREWNNSIQNWDEGHDWWYIFEDTRLVQGQILGSADVNNPTISHTFKYLKDAKDMQIMNTDWESRGNRCVYYESYLSNVKENYIVKGKKFSITDRTEINISKDIDQYVTIYNAQADSFKNEYTNEDWVYSETGQDKTLSGEKYRVSSKLKTRQIIPQLARNLVQNGTDMDSTDGWSPMTYLLSDSIFITPSVMLRGVESTQQQIDDNQIVTSVLTYYPAMAKNGEKWFLQLKTAGQDITSELNPLTFMYNNKSYKWETNLGWCDLKSLITDLYNACNADSNKTIIVYAIGTSFYYKLTNDNKYHYLCDKNDFIYKGLTRDYKTAASTSYNIFTLKDSGQANYEDPVDGVVTYYIYTGSWSFSTQGDNGIFTKTENTDVPPKTGNISDRNGQEIVNFGIIGQDRRIEKDKIYCLGLAVWAKENFDIKIGKGSLISDGEYTLVEEDNILKFTFGTGDDATIEYQLMNSYPDNFEDLKKNLYIPSDMPTPSYLLFKADRDIDNPYFVISSSSPIILFKLYLFEAYTKGQDSFEKEKSTYRYSGRNLFWPPNEPLIDISRTQNYQCTDLLMEAEMRKKIIFEDDIMLGSTYGYQEYFIQRLKTYDGKTYDTMGQKKYLTSDTKEMKANHLPLDAADYTEDDYTIETNIIDLNKCQYYKQNAHIDECDCSYGSSEAIHTCFYQKFGYCPFRFKTEKHDRRIRTLSINKSNRFNIIQQTSKVFEVYPQFYIEHNPNGSVIKDSDGEYLKKVFYITEKGRENKVGFRYEKNLKDISRNIVSENIVTKLYVLDVDSDLSKTGLCSIKTAEDNPSKDSYLINLDYYIAKGMLDGDEVEQDLYGLTPTTKDLTNKKNVIPSGFLSQLGYYNSQYDELSNKIINLQDASFTELQANLEVNYQGIITAQEQILKIKKQINNYVERYDNPSQYEQQQAYLNYLSKLSEQESILVKLIYSTFYTDDRCDSDAFKDSNDEYYPFVIDMPPGTQAPRAVDKAMKFFSFIADFEGTRKYWIDQHIYSKGILGQYNREYLQIQQWKRERASYLKLINQISTAFFKKYEPYLKEGTWSDSNYLTDNAYYFGALDVAADGSIPKVTYNISVIDIAPTSEEYEEIYDFDLADVTYVEDIGMFGIDKHTGFPNKLKVLISGVSEGLDNPDKDTITVQNFTTSFQDLFQQVTASVQSLTYNENIYKRSSNFTSLQNITNDSLQGALDTNELTLLSTDEDNIQVDNTGTRGSDINNHANKYKLDGQGLYFSNDGGQHWSVGVGPSGINADYIKVGTLDAGKIRIADSSYVYFSWDKDGIVAYRDPQAVNTDSKNINDAAIFNKYGLSVVRDGQIKLRAGYTFNGTDGEMNTETQLADEVGFYLYNSNGEIIFQTQNATDPNDADRETAVLKLIGEMYVGNSGTIVENAQKNYYKKYSFANNITIAPLIQSNIRTPISSELGPIIPEEPDLCHCDISNTLYEPKEAAAYIFWKESSLNKILIIKGNNQYIYEKRTISDTSPNRWFFYNGNENEILESNKINNNVTVHMNIRNESNQISQTFFIYGNNNIYMSDIVNTKTGQVFHSYIDDDINHTSVNLTQLDYYTYESNNNKYIKHSEWRYYVDNNWYYGEKAGTDPSQFHNKETSVALYLNNPSLSSNMGSTSEGFAQRLFVCCTQRDSENTASNLFSVLKDGTAYFGGKIHDKPNESNNSESYTTDLGDIIKIVDPGIKLSTDGSLFIAFKHIHNTENEGQDLPSYIGEAIETAMNDQDSKLNQAITNAVNQVNQNIGGIETEIEGIWNYIRTIGLIRHNHSISVETIYCSTPSGHSDNDPTILVPLFDTNVSPIDPTPIQYITISTTSGDKRCGQYRLSDFIKYTNDAGG